MEKKKVIWKQIKTSKKGEVSKRSNEQGRLFVTSQAKQIRGIKDKALTLVKVIFQNLRFTRISNTP